MRQSIGSSYLVVIYGRFGESDKLTGLKIKTILAKTEVLFGSLKQTRCR